MNSKMAFKKLRLFISGIILLVGGYSWGSFNGAAKNNNRALEFTEKLTLHIPEQAGKINIWMPVPVSDQNQTTEIVSVDSPYKYKVKDENFFGNKMIHIRLNPKSNQKHAEINVQYKIIREERRDLEQQSLKPKEKAKIIAEYLKPRGLEIINDEIRRISKETTKGIEDPLEKARAIYQYVLKNMKYDKSGQGWGKGDSVYACDVGKGNCTDFHSLFITMARASNVPARFQMGIPLPQSVEGKPSGGYHCWAEFYLEDKGWVPVDISEAWKNPAKSEYFFGHLDEDRIHVSTGREIALSPRQTGAPLNYFSKPYVEINGKPYKNFDLDRSYKNIMQRKS